MDSVPITLVLRLGQETGCSIPGHRTIVGSGDHHQILLSKSLSGIVLFLLHVDLRLVANSRCLSVQLVILGILLLLEQDCTMRVSALAAAGGVKEDEARAAIKKYEDDRTILGYQAIIDWDRVRKETVTALIEVNVTPQSIDGFDRIAERIYQYDEVESMYLMSGSFDLTVIISGRTLREVAQFVGERLAPIQGVTGTATHFILKKYKEKHLVFRPQDPEEREYIFV